MLEPAGDYLKKLTLSDRRDERDEREDETAPSFSRGKPPSLNCLPLAIKLLKLNQY
jgi:hypothetical protein